MLSNDLLLHADAHYHRRGCVSLPSSEWDRVVPQRYGRQGEGGGRGVPVAGTRARSRLIAIGSFLPWRIGWDVAR
jgi:hypothetical protein